LADLLVLVGTNLAWCHPILFQRIAAAKEKRPDLHIAINSGRDAYLFNGLLNFLRANDYLDYDFLENATEGFASALQAARLTLSSYLKKTQIQF
jgi:assimilatory nitrate reductase catalytic subunit